MCIIPSGNVIHYYLGDRNFYFYINNTMSALHFIVCGIIEGSVLGPYLYNLYFNDIPGTLFNLLALYADDTNNFATAHHPVFSINIYNIIFTYS